MSKPVPRYWPSARHFTEAVQCPGVSFSNPLLRETLPGVDRLGMPLVTSGQFAYVYKLKSRSGGCDFAVRCFRGYLGDRDQRYRAIQRHIERYPLSCLCGFTYEPEGILVGGQRFPILFMRWIEGPTLDLYLEEMIGRREVMLHLADEWLKLVAALGDAGVAHGDLQHGNIIVEHGRLRLVDHDGMFVPEMSGWSSSEVGHQHYQHPRRDARLFYAGLDNFSALVIYLSLLSLAEQPGLWAAHHDENLLFTKADFIDPASSALFSKIRLLGPEHRRLADVLAEAAAGEPGMAPSLLELVSVKAALPSWMNEKLDLEAKTKTREVEQASPALQRENSRWTPWRTIPSSPSSSVPLTPPSSTVQTIFGGQAKKSALASIRDPNEVFRNTGIFARELLRRTFVWWYWAVYLFLKILGLDFFYAMLIPLTCIATVCLIYGYFRARELAQNAAQGALPLHSPVASTSAPAAQVAHASWRRVAPQPLTPASIAATGPIIGNRVLSIYHLHDCQWVERISPKNLVSFSTASEASSAGYKPCRVCLP